MASVTFLEPGSDATQDLTFWPNNGITGTGTIASDTGQSYTGGRSIKGVTVNNAGGDNGLVSSGDGVCADAGTRVSLRIRLGQLPAINSPCMAVYQAGFGNGVWVIGFDTAGHILVGSEGPGILGTGTTVFSATTWYRISFSYVITSGTNWSFKLYINGTQELSLTQSAGTLTNTSSSEFSIGPGEDPSAGFGANSKAWTVWFDDIYIDNGTDLADPGTTDANSLRVTAKRPIANGTANNFNVEIGAGGSGTGTGHSPQVNERPLNTANGWQVVGSAVTEEYNIESVSAGDVDITGKVIKGVMGWVYSSSTLSETCSIIVDGTSSNISTTSTNTLFQKVSPNPTTYPAGTGSDIGMVSSAVSTVSLYEAGVLIAFSSAVVADVMEWFPRQATQQGPKIQNVSY